MSTLDLSRAALQIEIALYLFQKVVILNIDIFLLLSSDLVLDIEDLGQDWALFVQYLRCSIYGIRDDHDLGI